MASYLSRRRSAFATRFRAREAPKHFDFFARDKGAGLSTLRRDGRVLVVALVLIALYRMSDFLAGVMSNPLYVDPRLQRKRRSQTYPSCTA